MTQELKMKMRDNESCDVHGCIDKQYVSIEMDKKYYVCKFHYIQYNMTKKCDYKLCSNLRYEHYSHCKKCDNEMMELYERIHSYEKKLKDAVHELRDKYDGYYDIHI